MISTYLNIIGLLFDIAGVIILFIWGLSNLVTLDGTVFMLAHADTAEETETNKKEGRLYRRRSNLGLSLILIGFVFQLVANLASLCGGSSPRPSDEPLTSSASQPEAPSTVQVPKQ
jgi:hypothetical protein